MNTFDHAPIKHLLLPHNILYFTLSLQIWRTSIIPIFIISSPLISSSSTLPSSTALAISTSSSTSSTSRLSSGNWSFLGQPKLEERPHVCKCLRALGQRVLRTSQAKAWTTPHSEKIRIGKMKLRRRRRMQLSEKKD